MTSRLSEVSHVVIPGLYLWTLNLDKLKEGVGGGLQQLDTLKPAVSLSEQRL